MHKKYRIILGEKELVFRVLTAEESEKYIYAIRNFERKYEVEEVIFRGITNLEEKEIDELTAGTIPIVVYCSFKLSGYLKSDIDLLDKIDAQREAIQNNPYNKLYSIIISSQPSYNIDILKKKSLDELIELFAISELILGNQTIDTKQIRDSLQKTTLQKTKETIKSSKAGLKGVSKEELELVKKMIKAEEFNSELF